MLEPISLAMASKCQLCEDPYNTSDRTPKNLTCGHTFCVKCLQKRQDQSTVTCPRDQQPCLVPSGEADKLPTCWLIYDTLENERCTSCGKTPEVEVHCLPDHCGETLCTDCYKSHAKLFHTDLVAKLSKMKHQIEGSQTLCDNNDDIARMTEQSKAAINEVNRVFDFEKEKLIKTIKQQVECETIGYFEWKSKLNHQLANTRIFLDQSFSKIVVPELESDISDLVKINEQFLEEERHVSLVEEPPSQLTKYKPSMILRKFDLMMPDLYASLMTRLRLMSCSSDVTYITPISTPTQLVTLPDYTAAKYQRFYGKKGSGDNEFTYPWGISTSPINGHIAVTDPDNHRVHILTDNLRPITRFGHHKENPDDDLELSFPFGITYNSQGELFIADCHYHRIKHFTSTGSFINKFGSQGSGPGQFRFPYDLAWADNLLYVCDGENYRIQIFTETGTHVKTIGCKGTHAGEFPSEPMHIAVSHRHDKLIVSDFTGNLYFFHLDGQHMRTVLAGEAPYKLSANVGAIDRQGSVIVADWNDGQLVILGDDDEIISTISPQPGDHMDDPQALSLTLNGSVIVCDKNNHRLVLFDIPRITEN